MKVRAMRTVGALIMSALGALAVQGCASGTETDNPDDGGLVGFENSGCKKEAAAMSVVPGRSAEAFVTASDYDGLLCVEWERRDNGSLGLRFLNVAGGCSIPWEASVTRTSDGGLELLAANPTCNMARCGTCLYDLEFEVRDAEPAGLDVGLGLVSCAGMPPEDAARLTLPDDAEDSGILCRYAHASGYQQQAAATGRCGTRFVACSVQADCDPTCVDGLLCTEVDADDYRCLEPCETDDDCTPAGTARCVGGLCGVPAGF